ncbi:MAG: HD domain-containing protein [Candidatus Omnitrophica bacterium]|nr:HD domain-containing protein [Candidatus Omnitrophota bacterium]
MKKFGISFKLYTITISVLVITVLVTSGINIIRFRSMYIEALMDRARADAQDLREGIYQGLEYFPLESFSDMTTLLNARLKHKFSYAYIADRNHEILYHSDGITVNKKLDPAVYGNLVFNRDVKSVIVSSGKYYEMVIPVVYKFNVIGTIHIGLPKSAVDDTVIAMIIQNVAVLILILILSIALLYIVLARSITGPIARLREKVTEINREFKLPTYAEDETIDELTTFSHSFDVMTNELVKRTKELAETNRLLEIELAQRTAAERKLKESYRELQVTFEGSINAIATAIVSRDPYTAGHQQRVAELSCAIAEDIGLTGEQVREVYLAAVSHDIGKIAVPTEILIKKGKLTDEEMGIIRTHPQVGYDILKPIKFPWPLAEAVLQHHERMNGTGYPRRLPGARILLQARIIAVADVVEAISSTRPYREALGNDAAMTEIEMNKGTLYDARVADACLKLFREKHFAFSNRAVIEKKP